MALLWLGFGGTAWVAGAADGPGFPNVEYDPSRVGEILSIVNPGKAISSAVMHRGYLFVPLGADKRFGWLCGRL
jgi:hypothetical protein